MCILEKLYDCMLITDKAIEETVISKFYIISAVMRLFRYNSQAKQHKSRRENQ
jgi:phosphatidylserine synthase